jgi:putative salt-induced outer membrane protein YdiY
MSISQIGRSSPFVFCALLLLLPLLSVVAAAESEEQPPDWVPPASSKWDWLKLTSGEWVKGDMELMRDREVAFDSDKLDDLRIDWEDVDAMHLRKPHIFRLDSDENVQGIGVMRAGVLVVTDESGPREFPRAQIVSIIPGDGSELDYWSANANVAFGLRNGNTDQVDLSGGAGVKRETGLTRWQASYSGIYSEVESDKTTENHRAQTALDVFLTSRLYLTVPFVDYYRDEFQNLQHRIVPGIAIGYEFIRNPWVDWDASVGPGYVYTAYEEVQDGEDDDSHDGAVVFRTALDFDLPHGVEIDNAYRLQVVVTNTDQTAHHLESVLSTDIWGPLELDFTFILGRVEKPEEDSDGDRPDSMDIRILVGLSVDF